MKKKPVSPAEPVPSVGLRRFLYGTAAITGGAIMVIEILGAKMLSPYLGTSHFVWTAQIAVTLVALAIGYYVGGRMVDRSSHLGRMYGGILIAGAYVAATVVVHEPVAYALLRFDLAVGSLLTSALLYFVPLCLLAMVGPFFVRVLTISLSGVGGSVGRLTAISTLGSFAGTILISYLVIPFFPNSLTMYATALILIALAGAYFVGWGRTLQERAVVLAVALAGAALGGYGVRHQGVQDPAWEEVFRGNSDFGLLQVIQQRHGTHRYFVNDYLTQNTYDVVERKSISMFTYMLHRLPRAYVKQVDDVLCIGMGAGIVPMDFARDGARVDAVEINPAVVPLAVKFFGFDQARVNLTVGDGRHYVNRSVRRYDAVILDAFIGDSCPSHLMTREAFTGMRRILKPEGVLVINTFAELDGDEDFFGASLYRTLGEVFASVRVHRGRQGNTLFVASARTELAFVRPPDFQGVYPGCLDEVKDAFASLREPRPGHGRILTDDFNPVEFRDAPNRERLRRMLALTARGR